MVRDNVPFDQLLYGDIVYVGSAGAAPTAYAHDNNDHYRELQEARVDLSNPANLEQRQQSALPGTPTNRSCIRFACSRGPAAADNVTLKPRIRSVSFDNLTLLKTS